MTKIFNPSKTPVGIRINGAHKVIRPNTTVDLPIDESQAAKLAKRGLEVDFAFSEPLPSQEPLPVQEAEVLDYSAYTDDELREVAKANGVYVHHKAGRAKLLEALGT